MSDKCVYFTCDKYVFNIFYKYIYTVFEHNNFSF